MNKKIVTVLGPISPEELGVTLVHEHLLLDMKCLWHDPVEPYKKRLVDEPVDMPALWLLSRDSLISRDNLRLDDVETAVEELLAYKTLGGTALVEMTMPDIGRDPQGMAAIAKRSGIHVICGCGHYVQRCHPPDLARQQAESIAKNLVNEITEGILGTGVRPGIIGEIGTSYPITSQEEKVLRASSQAHVQTGAPINVHLSHPRKEGVKVLDILEEEGVDASHVALSHLDQVLAPQSLDYHKAIAERGAYVEYDDFGEEDYMGSIPLPRDFERVTALSRLIDKGCLSNLMISSDVCEKRHLEKYGGFGYQHILRDIVPMMKAAGITEREIRTMMIENPARFLAF